jgi:DNA end-binding protein Ku
MRPIWTGSIGFGLVSIPVRIYSATESSSLNLDMLDSKDHSRIKYKRVNSETGKEVAWDRIVKGYKMPNDEYVEISDKDFERANAKKSKVIEINQFCELSEIDSVYYESPYYLEPDKSGARAYALLREALHKTGRAGVATFVMRNKETLAVLKPSDKVIVLNRIRFQEEIRETGDLKLPPKSEVKAGELKMAITLIDQLTGKFDISKFKDTYTDELLKVIKAKAKGVKLKEPKLRVVHTETKDLMEQLKASLEPQHKHHARKRKAS